MAPLDAESLFAEEEVVQPDVAGLAMGGNLVLTTNYGRLDILQLVSPDFEYGDLARRIGMLDSWACV